MQPSRSFRDWISGFRTPQPALPDVRPAMTHVVLLDGTMSTLCPGHETSIGLIYRLLHGRTDDAPVTLYYEPGIQWRGIRRAHEVMAGIGINQQIKRAYLFLARNYQPGDQIVLMGFSRGAYAVRSLAGLIDRIGLLRAAQVTPETLDRIYRIYRCDPDSADARAMKAARCHSSVTIAFVGVFDTVRALGMRWPLLWRILPTPHPYHNHTLGPATEVARQALALHETRQAYAPVLWDTSHDQAATGCVRQMWFRGSHGDVGGQIDGVAASRPLANIPLTWMLEEAEGSGVPLPENWRSEFPTDINAPSIGTLRRFGKLFVARKRRVVGRDPSERMHPTTEQPTRAAKFAELWDRIRPA